MVGFGDVRLAEAKAQGSRVPSTGPASFEGLSVKDRVERLAADVHKNYNCTLTINQSTRSPKQAQQFHVCHMFLHNMFKLLRPKHVSEDGRTIAWAHIADASVTWALIDDPETFLRTSAGEGEPAYRERGEYGTLTWASGHEPDKAASTRAMALFLSRHHVRSMAAPGQNGCGEPCGCGGMASKHITGAACDVSGLQELQDSLAKENYGTGIKLDDFLKDYGLCRPMAHLQGNRREEWHVEALSRRRRRIPAAAHPHAKHAGREGASPPGAHHHRHAGTGGRHGP